MKPFLALQLLALTLLSSPAYAINCARASTDVEHIICDDPALVRADAEMNRAYAAIIKVAPDPEIHAMLVTSQKRWIAARDSAFSGLDRATDGRTGEGYPKRMQRNIVLQVIRERTDTLKWHSHHEPKQFHLIQEALDQRRFASQFTGGAFAGFETKCFFYPRSQDEARDSYGYACMGTMQYQNRDRICSETNDWATYRVYTSRAVAALEAGTPKIVASCKEDACFETSGGAEVGHQSDADNNATILSPPLPKLDAEVDGTPTDEAESWIKACLAGRPLK